MAIWHHQPLAAERPHPVAWSPTLVVATGVAAMLAISLVCLWTGP